MAEARPQLKLATPQTVQTEPQLRYLNRELSLLDYHLRVLALAEDQAGPLLERVRFLAISGQMLDDLFMVRVAGLQEQLIAAVAATSPDGLTAQEQLRAIRSRAQAIQSRQLEILEQELVPRLAATGIRIRDAADLEAPDRDYLARVFADQIFPVLTPLAVDPAHPFPYISNLSLNLAVLVRDPLRKESHFARVKVPPLLPRFIALPDGANFVPLEQVIAAQAQALFPGMEIIETHPFRVTRDADLDLVDSEAEDLLAAIQTELRRQRRHGRAVRLEVPPALPPAVLELLMRELELSNADVYTVGGLLDLAGLDGFCQLDRPDLKDEPWSPQTQPRLRDVEGEAPDIFEVLSKGDVLVHHPYDSFATSVEAFIDQAAVDPQVLAIKQTLYRTSGPASPIAKALIRAAERGKQVVALVELKARGDEQANIAWAEALEEAGVHVAYGLVGLKTHAKITLVVRQEGSRIRHYVHVGTGNYNPRTAMIYEDVGLLSADPNLGLDVIELFNLLTGYSRQRRYRKLLVAPTGLRAAIIDLIDKEAAASEGRVTIKVNNLVDPEVIDALYEASRAGTKVDLLVRGICCLRPGVPGLSENIRVRSILGRFLEHSRIFAFGGGRRARSYYLGSSDMMPRNLDRRVEAVVPVTDTALQKRFQEMLDVVFADNCWAWELGPEGEWSRVPGGDVDAQQRFQELARQRAAGNGTSLG